MTGKQIVFIASLTLPILAQEVVIQPMPVGGCTGKAPTKWVNGNRLQIERNQVRVPTVCVQDGSEVRRIDVTLPDTGAIQIYDVALNPQGELAISGRAERNSHQPMSFVATLQGQKLQVTETFPYFPVKLAVANDRSIWTMGWVENEDHTQTKVRFQVRRFSAPGVLLSQFTPRLKRGSWPENSHLVARTDRASIFTNQNEYVEFDPEGNELLRRQGPGREPDHKHYLGFAVGPEGRIAISFLRQGMGEVWMTRRTGLDWTRINVEPSVSPWLAGFDTTGVLMVESR